MISGADPSASAASQGAIVPVPLSDQPEDTEAIAVLPNGDVTIVTKGRTSTISFFGLTRADIARAVNTAKF